MGAVHMAVAGVAAVGMVVAGTDGSDRHGGRHALWKACMAAGMYAQQARMGAAGTHWRSRHAWEHRHVWDQHAQDVMSHECIECTQAISSMLRMNCSDLVQRVRILAAKI